MLVDDHKNLLTTLGEFLAFKGYAVLKAASGEEALAQLRRQTPDLIILDIGMPGMGGLGFLKRVSAEGGGIAYPVLVLTAKAGMEEFFDTLPVEGFLAKPCPMHVVEEKVREILAKRRAGAESSKCRVLIVEDDSQAMASLRQAFEIRDRFVVEFADNGADALARATLAQPNVVVINEVLTGMSGSKLATLLGSVPSTQHIPVVLHDESHLMDGRRFFQSSVSGRKEKYLSTSDPDLVRRAVEELLEA